MGRALPRVAMLLRVATSTLRGWMRRAWRPRGRRRGRPPRAVDPEALRQVDELLAEGGGRVAIAALRRCSAVPRARLEAHVRAWRRRHARHAQRLQWTWPGATWAMDWTETDAPVRCAGAPAAGAGCRLVLVVRDLASSMQLLARPCAHATADAAAGALRTLFARHGAPLVLKTDNGSNVAQGPVPGLLAACGVTHLRSPPRTPRYNGAVEAGIGSIKMRMEAIAAARGRPGAPTADDLEEARLEANALARPRGRDGPTPDEAWDARWPIDEAARKAMRAAIAQATQIEVARLLETDEKSIQAVGMHGCAGAAGDILAPLEADQRASVARRAIRRALEALGHLVTRTTATSSTDLEPEMRE